jgi:hypothetical protein
LQAFLRDPPAIRHEFRAAQHRRDHLANEIRNHGLDLDLETIRKGSPHLLICTKNRATYHRACRTHATHLNIMRDLLKTPPPADADPGNALRERISRALKGNP